MNFAFTKKGILFSAVCAAILFMIIGVALWRFRQTPSVCKLLEKQNITADKVDALVLHQHYTQIGDKVVKGRSYKISHPKMIKRILSALHRTNAISLERSLVINSELVFYLKNDRKSQRVGVVMSRDDEPLYIGLDYAIPSVEFKQIIKRIFTFRTRPASNVKVSTHSGSSQKCFFASSNQSGRLARAQAVRYS